MSRSRIAVLAFFIFVSLLFLVPDAFSATVFGPQEITISRWHSHLSRHTFELEQGGDGVIEVTKNTPQQQIKGGFILFNGKLIRLRRFLTDEDLTFEKEVSLQSTNRFIIFTRGTPGASISLSIKHKDGLVPQIVAFTAAPPSIKIGESSTLTWQTNNAETCEISPGIGIVDATGSVTVTPYMPTEYTLTITSFGQTITATAAVEIENSPPLAVARELTTAEDTAVSITLEGTDPDNNPLGFSVHSQPLYGVLTGEAPDLTYTPSPNFDKLDSFEFIVNDGQVDSEPALVAITVTPVNDAPSAESQSMNLNEDEVLPIALPTIDADGDSLIYEITTQPAHGTLDGSLPEVTYRPAADFSGTDSFEFVVSDGISDPASAQIALVVNSVNDAPVAAEDNAATAEDHAVIIDVLANDEDADGDVLFVSEFSQPVYGAVDDNGDGTFTYIPFFNYYGADEFSYTVSDAAGQTDAATVYIVINAINDAPTAISQSLELAEDETISIALNATDIENDSLIYRISTGPSHGTLSGTAPDLLYTPEPDYFGPDEFTFSADDPQLTGSPATVSLSIMAVNDPPIADAGIDRTVSRLDTVVLNGNGSGDAENDALSFQWSLKSTPSGSTAVLSQPLSEAPSFIADLSGNYELELVVNDGQVDSLPAAVTVTAILRQVTVPELTDMSQAQAEAAIVAADLVVGAVTSEYSTEVASGHIIGQTPPQGDTVDEMTAVDLVVSLGPDLQPPAVSISASASQIPQDAATTLSWSATNAHSVQIDNNIGPVDMAGALEVFPEHTVTYTIVAIGAYGNSSAQVSVKVISEPQPQPEGAYGAKYEDQIPADAIVESYDARRFSLITGMVKDVDGVALAGVSITILDHAEYGTVKTDGQGAFTIPVQGGGTLNLVYKMQGYIAAQRKVYVPWNDNAVADSVALITEDPATTTLTFDDNPATVVTHKSTDIVDDSGSRALTVVLTGDNKAWLLDEKGNDVAALETITVRATEYTTPQSMPAALPPTSAFTYCAELTVDGIQRVRFDKPVITWIDNFIGVGVGEIVPVGYFDRDKGIWIPDENGLVVKLLDSDADGIVDALDSNGDDLPDDLNGNGSFCDEVQGLEDSQRYIPGTTFWRSETTHFSPRDWNYAFRPAPDATDPNPKGMLRADQKKTKEKDSPICIGSYVAQKSRTFHEDIPIAGTPMTLHYDSSRSAGYTPGVITIPASGDSVPDSLLRIVVKVKVAGRSYEVELPAQPNQVAEITWDGLDQLGRPVTGSVMAHVQIGFVYNGVYWVAAGQSRAFGQAGTRSLFIPARESVTLWKEGEIQITRGQGTIAEGWSISDHHSLSPTDTSILFKGDGTINKNNAVIIDTYAGTGSTSRFFSGMGGPAKLAQIPTPSALAMDAAGNLYVFSSHLASYQNWLSHILKIDSQGIVTDFFRYADFNIYGGYLAIDPQGNLYYSGYYMNGNTRGEGGCIKKVTPQGAHTTVIGTCGADNVRYSGIHIDNQGNIFAAVKNQHRVVKRDPSGAVTVVAGTGQAGNYGDGGLAVNAQLYSPEDVFVDDEGNIYIAHLNGVRKVDAGGIITTVAGGGSYNASGDGGAATAAYLPSNTAVTMDAAGNLYIADQHSRSIRRVDTQGVITTVAGINNTTRPGFGDFTGDGGAATNAKLSDISDVLIDPDGNIFIADLYNNRVRKVSPPAPGLRQDMAISDIAFTENSGIGYIMSAAGHHQKTIDLATGVNLYRFGYDQNNNLVSILDQFDNQITITWENEVPTAIISPDGISTDLTVDPASGNLTRITHPDGSYTDFEYGAGSLLTLKTEPQGNRFDHVYDQNGRLTEFYDDEGGSWIFSRTVFDDGQVEHKVTSGQENETLFTDYADSTGAYETTVVAPTADETSYSQSADGLTATEALPCGMQRDYTYDVDPEYKFKYLKQLRQITPDGLQKVRLYARSYLDTNSDGIKDLVIDQITVNGKTTKIENKVAEAKHLITSPQGRLTTAYYNPDNLTTNRLAMAGLHDTEYGYDTKGRLTSIKRNTRESRYTYSSQGYLDSVTDGEAATTYYGHDNIGRMTSISRPDGGLVNFAYDDNGNLTGLTIQETAVHEFGHNTVNKKDAYHTPQSGSYQFSYNYDRELTEVTYPSEKKIFYNYEDTLLKQVLTPEDTIDYSYLCGGKVGTVSNGADSINYDYDGKLITSESSAGTLNQTLSYTYNHDFNLNSFIYAGQTFNYTYDNDNLLTGAGVFTIERQPENGQPQKVSDGNLLLDRGFNLYGEVDSQTVGIADQAVADFSYGRDNNGQITTKSETINGLTTDYRYEYDPVGRLSLVFKDDLLVEEYRYTAKGTRSYMMNQLRGISARSYSYSEEDHLLTAGDATYEYDKDGFLTKKSDAGQDTLYAYSLRGELLRVDLPDGRVIEYLHDPLGRRIAKLVNGAIVEKYLWQGLTQLLAVYDGADNLLMRFEYADDRMPPAMTQEGVTYYLIYDQIGSLRVVADGAGNVIKKISYDAFGNVLADSNPGFQIPFGFAGGLHDRDTGLVRFGYRDYDPDIGRWTAKDPIGFAGGDTDLYGYVLNDPINNIDPRGQEAGDTFGDAWIEEQFQDFVLGVPDEIMEESIETATTASEYLTCTAECSSFPLAGEAASQALKCGLNKSLAKKAAKNIAAKWVKKAIPVAGQVSTFITGEQVVECIVDCALK